MNTQLKIGLLLLLPLLALGQSTPYSSPDSSDQAASQLDLNQVPLWAPPTGLAAASTSDTLLLPVLPGLTSSKPWSQIPRWLGLGLIVTGSALSYYYHDQAEGAYKEYLVSGNPAELNKLFSRAERFDRLAGWSFAAAESGLILISLSVIWGP